MLSPEFKKKEKERKNMEIDVHRRSTVWEYSPMSCHLSRPGLCGQGHGQPDGGFTFI
jgi:hypothetical protein